MKLVTAKKAQVSHYLLWVVEAFAVGVAQL
jgi:hypothetical protein